MQVAVGCVVIKDGYYWMIYVWKIINLVFN